MKFKAETTLWLLVGTTEEGGTDDFDDAPTNVQRAALRAIAEHLGPEATIETLGTDANVKQFADAQTREAIADARFDPDKTPPAKCIEILRTKYDAIHESLGGTLEALEAAMAAAHGRDYTMPADTAISCIRMLIEQRDDARQAQRAAASESQRLLERAERAERERDGHESAAEHLGKALDTARAQLREWREVGNLALDRVLDRITYPGAGDVRAKIRRLLSATPDEGDESASKRWQRLYQETQARLDETDKLYDILERAAKATADDRNRLRKRVEELEVELSRWRAAGEHLGGRLGLPDGPDAVAEALRQYVAAEDALGDSEPTADDWRKQATEAIVAIKRLRQRLVELKAERDEAARVRDAHFTALQRAETAVEAMRPAVEETLRVRDERGTPLPPAGHHGETMAVYLRPTIEKALADYDAGKGAEPTGAQPQDRVGGKLEPLELRCNEEPADRLHMRPLRYSINLAVKEGESCGGIYLDRESVRRLRDWSTAWLEDNVSVRETGGDSGGGFVTATRDSDGESTVRVDGEVVADTPEAIARDCWSAGVPGLDESVIVARIRALADAARVEELLEARETLRDSLYDWNCAGQKEALEYAMSTIEVRIRELEAKGGAK